MTSYLVIFTCGKVFVVKILSNRSETPAPAPPNYCHQMMQSILVKDG